MIFTLENELEKNKDDNYYYNPANPGLSASTLKKYHPTYKYKEDETGWKHPLEFGSAVHYSILEPEKYFNIEFNDEEDNHLTSIDKANIERMYGAMMLNKEIRDIITHPDAQFEVPAVKIHEGVLLKGKFDIVLGDELWDIKTTSSLKRFDYLGSQIFMYPLSNFHYYLLSSKKQNFIVVDKKTFEVAIIRTDNNYYQLGKRQWDQAWNEWKIQQYVKL